MPSLAAVLIILFGLLIVGIFAVGLRSIGLDRTKITQEMKTEKIVSSDGKEETKVVHIYHHPPTKWLYIGSRMRTCLGCLTGILLLVTTFFCGGVVFREPDTDNNSSRSFTYTETLYNADGTPVDVNRSVISTAPVIIALQDLPRGFRITEDFISGPVPAVGIALYPAENRPENSFENVEDIVGLIVRSDIPRESPILATQLVEDYTGLASVGSDYALILPPGLVGVPLTINANTLPYGIQPGDYVDVILSFEMQEVDQLFQSPLPNQFAVVTKNEAGIELSEPILGRLEPSRLSEDGIIVMPSDAPKSRLVTQRTIQRAYLIFVEGQNTFLGKFAPTPFDTPTPSFNNDNWQPQPTTAVSLPPTQIFDAGKQVRVTLGVEPQDAVVLLWANNTGVTINFVIRSATDVGDVTTTQVSLDYILENYDVLPPPVLPFTIVSPD